MKIVLSRHARERLNQPRQKSVTIEDIYAVASSIPGKVDSKQGYRIRNAISKSGKLFDLPIADRDGKRIVITIIGI